MSDRLERLTNLIAVLLEGPKPLLLEEIVEKVPGYPPDRESSRRQFERDKATLREVGIPVSLEAVHAFDQEIGYRIHRKDYQLPPIDLTDEERLALHLAVTAVRLEGDDGGPGKAALQKLGALEGTGTSPLAALRSVPAMPFLFDAMRRRSPVSFAYRGEIRHLHPYGLLSRGGHWYVIGWDEDREDLRSFRADRLESVPEAGPPNGFERPAGFDPRSTLRQHPWRFGDEEPVEAQLLVDADQAPWVLDEVGEEAVVERRDGGSVVIGLTVTNRAAFRSFVLGLLDHAEVLGPPELRADVVSWLETVA